MTSLPANCSCLLPVLGGAFDPWNALPWAVLDDSVVAILREQARARGVSLEQSLREMLTQAAQQHSDVRQRLAALRRQTPARAQELDVAALIREGREQR